MWDSGRLCVCAFFKWVIKKWIWWVKRKKRKNLLYCVWNWVNHWVEYKAVDYDSDLKNELWGWKILLISKMKYWDGKSFWESHDTCHANMIFLANQWERIVWVRLMSLDSQIIRHLYIRLFHSNNLLLECGILLQQYCHVVYRPSIYLKTSHWDDLVLKQKPY